MADKKIKVGLKIIPQLEKQEQLIKDIEKLLANQPGGANANAENARKLKEAKELFQSLNNFLSKGEIEPAHLKVLEQTAVKLSKTIQQLARSFGSVDIELASAIQTAENELKSMAKRKEAIRSEMEAARATAPGRMYGGEYQLYKATTQSILDKEKLRSPIVRKTRIGEGTKIETVKQLKSYEEALKKEISSAGITVKKQQELNIELTRVTSIFQKIVFAAESVRDKLTPLSKELEDIGKQETISKERVKNLAAQKKIGITELPLSPEEKSIKELMIEADTAVFNVKGAFVEEKAGIAEERREKEEVIKASDGVDSVKNFTQAVEDNTSTLGRAVKQISIYGIALKMLRTAYRLTIQTVKEIDKSLTQQAMVSGKTKDEVYALLESYQKLSKQLGATSTEVSAVATMYLQQGKNVKDTLILTEVAVKAAKVASIDTTESVNYLTTAVNGFKLASEDAIKVSDKFAALAASSATSYEELAIALSKVASQANLAGLSMDYTLGLLAKGIETTREAPETIGTALKTILARMREISDYGETLEDVISLNNVERQLSYVNVELRNTNGELRSTEDVLDELGRKWDTLTANQQAAIAKALAGTRQQSRLISIMQDYQRTIELVEIASNSIGATNAQQAAYLQGMEAALNRLKTAYQKLITTVTNSKVIIWVINTISKSIEYIADLLDGNVWKKWSLLGAAALLLISKNLDTLIYKFKWFTLTQSTAVKKMVAETKHEERTKSITNLKKEAGIDKTGVKELKQAGSDLTHAAGEHTKTTTYLRQVMEYVAGLFRRQEATTNISGVPPTAPQATDAPKVDDSGGLPAPQTTAKIAGVMQVVAGLTMFVNFIVQQSKNIRDAAKRQAEKNLEKGLEIQNEIYNNVQAISAIKKFSSSLETLSKKSIKTADDLSQIAEAKDNLIEELAGTNIAEKQRLRMLNQERLLNEAKKIEKEKEKTNKESLKDLENLLIRNQGGKTAVDWAGNLATAGAAGAMVGAGIGSIIAPGLGTAIGAGIGGAIGLGTAIGMSAAEAAKIKKDKEVLEETLNKEEGLSQVRYLFAASLNTKELKETIGDVVGRGAISVYAGLVGRLDKEDFLEMLAAGDGVEATAEKFIKSVSGLEDSFVVLGDSSQGMANRITALKNVQESLIKQYGAESAIVKALKEEYQEWEDIQKVFGEGDFITALEEYGATIGELNDFIATAGKEAPHILKDYYDAILAGNLEGAAAIFESLGFAAQNALSAIFSETTQKIASEQTSLASQVKLIRDIQANWLDKTAAEREAFLRENAGLFMTDGLFDQEKFDRFLEGRNINDDLEAYLKNEANALLEQANAAMIDAEVQVLTRTAELLEEQSRIVDESDTVAFAAWKKSVEETTNRLNEANITLGITKKMIEDIPNIFEESLADIIKQQQEELSIYKKYLQEKANLEIKALNTQKEAYEKYFAAINEAVADEDYEAERDKILSNIYKLSGSTDADSLNKIAQLEAALESKEKDRLEELRKRGQELLVKSLDDEVKNINEKIKDQLEREEEMLKELRILNKGALLSNILTQAEGKTAEELANIVTGFSKIFSLPLGIEGTDLAAILRGEKVEYGAIEKTTEGDEILNLTVNGKEIQVTQSQNDILYSVIMDTLKTMGWYN